MPAVPFPASHAAYLGFPSFSVRYGLLRATWLIHDETQIGARNPDRPRSNACFRPTPAIAELAKKERRGTAPLDQVNVTKSFPAAAYRP